jgi:importin subunit alpha-6/7
MLVADKSQARNRLFQQTPDLETYRQARDSSAVQLRKKKRIEHVAKRRANLEVCIEQYPTLRFPVKFVSSGLEKTYPELTNEFYSDVQRIGMLISRIKLRDYRTIRSLIGCLKELMNNNAKFPYGSVFDEGIIDVFLTAMMGNDEDLVLDMLKCLTILSNEADAEVVNKIADKGVVEVLCFLLKSAQNREILEASIWTLSNLLSEGGIVKAIATKEAVHKDLLRRISSNDVSMNRILFWTLSNLAKGKPGLPLPMALEMARVAKLGLESEDTDIIIETSWLLFYLAEAHAEIIDLLFQFQLIEVLMKLLRHYDSKIQYPALKTFGTVSSVSDFYSEQVLKMGLIQIISPLMTHPHKSMKKEVLFILSNLLAGNGEIVLAVLNSPCISTLLEMTESNDFELRKEAVWGVANACCCRDIRVLGKVIELRMVPVLVSALVHNNSELLDSVLEGILKLLDNLSHCMETNYFQQFLGSVEECCGFSRVVSLLHHANPEISHKSAQIMGFFPST